VTLIPAMFRSFQAFRGLVAAAPVATGAVQLAQWKKSRKAAHCEVDCTSVAIGVVLASGIAGFFTLRGKDGAAPKPVRSFERRLQSAYSTNAVGKAVLADCAVAHPELVALSSDSDINKSNLAVANHIREMWASILSEQFHFPRGFFIELKASPFQSGVQERQGQTKNLGQFKISIAHLKHNKVAVKWGIHTLAEAFDRNRDGVLDFHEFATMILINSDFQGQTKRSKATICKLLYTVLDEDGDGKVTQDEFESFMIMASKLGKVNESAPKDTLALWKQYDQDGNGILSYTEFLAFARVVLNLSDFPGEFP